MESRRHGAGSGFSLIELMIVLAIIGITSTMAIATYIGQIENTRVKSDVRGLEQTVQLAKMHAITENVRHGIYFDRGKGCYFMFKDNAPADGDEAFTGALNYDEDTGFIMGHDNENSTIEDFVLKREPTYLSRRNRFTCIFTSSSTTGHEIIMFDSMGRIVVPDPIAIGNSGYIMVQRSPDNPTADEEKPRGWVWIDVNSGITDSVLVQPFNTDPGTWCTR